MKPSQYRQLADTEDRHWWHQSRLTLAGRFIDRMTLPVGPRILDVGCGAGGTTRFLQRYGQVVGIDRSEYSLVHARRKTNGTLLAQADANTLGAVFRAGSFDLITFFNVLYHKWMVDDQAILTAAARLLRPGGHLLLTEPAFSMLARRKDRLQMAKRRYRLGDFEIFFQTAGLHYAGGQYFTALGVPVCLAMAFWDRLRSSRNGDHPPETADEQVGEMSVPAAPINGALQHYMNIEARMLGTLAIPVGVTLLATARK